MNAGRVTIDTNILVYAFDTRAADKHAQAVRIVRRARGWDCVLLLQVLAEFFAVMTGKGRLGGSEVAALVEDWMQVFPIQAAGPGTLRRAMRAVQAHRLSFWDAMLWAAAREAGCTLLLSEDFQHGRVLDGVRFHNPFVEAGPLPFLE
jgi:predicted nucleic acid-binding protein